MIRCALTRSFRRRFGCRRSLRRRFSAAWPGPRGPASKVAGSTNSNAQGFFRTDLTAGRYYFRVTAEGFRTEDAGRGIVLDRNEGYVVQNFSLVRGESPKEGTTSKRPSEPAGP